MNFNLEQGNVFSGVTLIFQHILDDVRKLSLNLTWSGINVKMMKNLISFSINYPEVKKKEREKWWKRFSILLLREFYPNDNLQWYIMINLCMMVRGIRRFIPPKKIIFSVTNARRKHDLSLGINLPQVVFFLSPSLGS